MNRPLIGKIIAPVFVLDYSSSLFKGWSLSDTVCVAYGANCVDNFNFMGITNQMSLNFEDGILGLSPNSSYNGPSFVGRLKDQGVIDKIMISLNLSK